MSARKKRDALEQVLEMLDSVRAEAGILMAESQVPVFDEEQADAITAFLEESVILYSDRILAMRDIIARTERIRAQMADEIEATQAKQSAFFNALSQLNGNQAKLVRAKIEDAEDEYAKRNSGEYATLPVWEAAQIILRKSGRAMTTREIVAALRDGGKQLGPKATSAVSAALKQGKAGEIFKPVKISGARQRWTLRDDGS